METGRSGTTRSMIIKWDEVRYGVREYAAVVGNGRHGLVLGIRKVCYALSVQYTKAKASIWRKRGEVKGTLVGQVGVSSFTSPVGSCHAHACRSPQGLSGVVTRRYNPTTPGQGWFQGTRPLASLDQDPWIHWHVQGPRPCPA